MEERHRRHLAGIAGSDIRFDQPMRLYTTFRAGGNAAAFYRARDIQGLCRVLSYAAGEAIPVLVVGKGSNILVTDGGFDGLAVRLLGDLARVEADTGGQSLEVGGGAAVRRMMNACIQNGLGGIEFLAGIPGTAGGAVVMNAGAHGRETGDVLESVTIVVPGGDVVERPAGDLTFSYRACRLPQGAVVTGARFHVEREGRKVVSERVNAHLERRRRALPQGFPSAGSVFRNPEGGFAGRLVDEAGLKGRRIGGAMISPVHGNVIVNTGGATAGDILALVNLAREEVLRRTGVELEPEIRVAGS